MRASDLVLFLVGNRGAIERIAGCRWAVLVGALLVASAGIARNGDHLYLLGQPEWIVGPFAMSLVSTTFLYAIAEYRLRLAAQGPLSSQYGAFLRLFWMTAPCAWLYAIPVEQWTDLLTATKWNLGFLIVVALWRVALIVRALSVLTGVHGLRALLVVLPPAGLEMAVGSLFQGLSLVGIMGGMRLSPQNQFLVDAGSIVGAVSFWSFVGFGLLSWFVYGKQYAATPLDRPPSRFPRAATLVAAACLVAAALASIPMQARIANAFVLDRMIRNERYDAAIRFAAARTRADFPEARHLPPDPEKSTHAAKVLARLPKDAPKWLRDAWDENLTSVLRRGFDLSGDDWAALRKAKPEIAERLVRVRAAAERIEALDNQPETTRPRK